MRGSLIGGGGLVGSGGQPVPTNTTKQHSDGPATNEQKFRMGHLWERAHIRLPVARRRDQNGTVANTNRDRSRTGRVTLGRLLALCAGTQRRPRAAHGGEHRERLGILSSSRCRAVLR